MRRALPALCSGIEDGACDELALCVHVDASVIDSLGEEGFHTILGSTTRLWRLLQSDRQA